MIQRRSGTQVDMSRIKRLLIIKMSAMGDVVHALPVAAALKESFPHLEISWAVESIFAPLLTGNPTLERVIAFPKMSGRRLRSGAAWSDYAKNLDAVRKAQFDLTLDLQGLTKSAAVAFYSGAPRRLGYHWLRELATLIEQPVPQRPESIHIVDQYLDVAQYLGADVTAPQFPLHIPHEEDVYVAQMLCEAGLNPDEPFITINPASAQKMKEWGTDKYGALADTIDRELGLPTVLVTADALCAAQVQAAARIPVVSLAKRTNLKQLCAVLRRCAGHICGDTGSGHIAAALGRPVISIVGPTDPDRSCPYGQRDTTLSRRDRCGSACRSHHCEYAAPHCLNAVTVEDVLEKLQIVKTPAGKKASITGSQGSVIK